MPSRLREVKWYDVFVTALIAATVYLLSPPVARAECTPMNGCTPVNFVIVSCLDGCCGPGMQYCLNVYQDCYTRAANMRKCDAPTFLGCSTCDCYGGSCP